jgi:serine/threonine protein phosphatase PrpC
MVEPVATATDPSGPGPNEDAAGSAGDERRGAAWVIDGATDVAGRTFVPGASSDAGWYARTLDAAFSALSPGDPVTVARAAIERAAAAWAAEVGGAPVPRHGLPSAAVAWAGWSEDRLTVAGLGDCTVILRPDGGPARALGRQGVSVAEVALNDAVRRLQEAGVADASARRAALSDRLQSARARMNTPGGYWIFSIDPAAAERLDRVDVRLTGAGHLLLATDGFWRLVDPYGVHTADTLMDAVVARGPAALLADLRALEAADADCVRFPRVKARDDATAVLLRYG